MKNVTTQLNSPHNPTTWTWTPQANKLPNPTQPNSINQPIIQFNKLSNPTQPNLINKITTELNQSLIIRPTH